MSTHNNLLFAACKHFNGIQHKVCRAGVSYMDVRDASGPGMAKFPCLEHGLPCPKVDYPTDAEVATAKLKHEKALDAWIVKVASGICHTCDSQIDYETQIGPCVYANPCGHRIGQTRERKPAK